MCTPTLNTPKSWFPSLPGVCGLHELLAPKEEGKGPFLPTRTPPTHDLHIPGLCAWRQRGRFVGVDTSAPLTQNIVYKTNNRGHKYSFNQGSQQAHPTYLEVSRKHLTVVLVPPATVQKRKGTPLPCHSSGCAWEL